MIGLRLFAGVDEWAPARARALKKLAAFRPDGMWCDLAGVLGDAPPLLRGPSGRAEIPADVWESLTLLERGAVFLGSGVS